MKQLLHSIKMMNNTFNKQMTRLWRGGEASACFLSFCQRHSNQLPSIRLENDSYIRFLARVCHGCLRLGGLVDKSLIQEVLTRNDITSDLRGSSPGPIRVVVDVHAPNRGNRILLPIS